MCLQPGCPGHDLGCGSTETRHRFCSQCVAQLHQCPICRQRHPLCARRPPRETQDEDLTLATIRMLATQHIWGPHDHIGGGDSPDVEWLETLEVPTPPPARCPFQPARWQVPAGENPTNQAPNHEPYDRVLQGSLPLPGELRSIWDWTTMNVENYRAVTVALSIRLPFAFGWLLREGEWAIGLAQNAQGHEFRELFFRSGGLRPGDTIYRVMAAWLTWRQIPVPEWLQPVVERAHQPTVPQTLPGTYANAAVARTVQSVQAPAQYWSSSSNARRSGESYPSTLPWRNQQPGYPSSSSTSIQTQLRPWSTAGATGAPEPSQADPPSPRHERAARRAARRYLPAPQHRRDSTSAPPQGATTED